MTSIFVLLLSLTAHATDYHATFKDIYDQAAKTPTPISWKADFMPGAFTQCAQAESYHQADFKSTVLGICTFTSAAAGPLVPAKAYESICSGDLSNGYGFQADNQPSIDGNAVDTSNSAEFIEVTNGSPTNAIMRYRRTKDILAFKSSDERIYGYCWK